MMRRAIKFAAAGLTLFVLAAPAIAQNRRDFNGALVPGGALTTVGSTVLSVGGTTGTLDGMTRIGYLDTNGSGFNLNLRNVSTGQSATRTLNIDSGNVQHSLALGTTANTITFPSAASFTLAGLSVAQTFTAEQQFGSGSGTPVHVDTGQTTPPSIGATCVQGGGSATVAGTDFAGLITTGTLATGCTMTFNVAYVGTPFCTVTSQTSLASFVYTLSNTAITITLTAATGDKINYHCIGPSGG